MTAPAGEDWLQLKYDSRRSGDVPDRSVTTPLQLEAAVALTDAIFTAPVIADGRVYVVDGSGVAYCIEIPSGKMVWKQPTRGGVRNCNNVSSPAVLGAYLHFGTMAGSYFVLDRDTGAIVREVRCEEPIFSAPAVGNNRAYFATLGARVYAVEPDGTVCWIWDFVREQLGFTGDRYSGADWLKHKKERVTWRDHFFCSRNVALHGKRVVVPAGGKTIWLEDRGDHGQLLAEGIVPAFAGKEFPATFGQSIGSDGTVYRQWHRRDNAGRVEMLRLTADSKVETDYVRGTETAINLFGLLSFSSVSIRARDVYRTRPEAGLGFCKHLPGSDKPERLGGYPSIAPPILLRDQGVVGGLDGKLYVLPLAGQGKGWSFATAFGTAISAPAAVADGRILFGCEDGYLYILGPNGNATLPTRDLCLHRIRSPLTGELADAKYDWFTNYGDFSNRNSSEQLIRPPLKVQWIRRYEGTFKHLPTCGGGRMYTHTSEGQIFAVEQETGRLLWRRYFPDVYLSFTAPLYYEGKLFVPQAGITQSRMRCLDAATGKLLWEAAFTGSPSWSRQAPPIIHKGLAIYASGTGKYAAQGTEKAYVMKGEPAPTPDGAEVMSWIYTHNNPYYPKDNKPLIWAWDLENGQEVWTKDFSEFGTGGNDCGLCLMDGTLYYSTFFGYSASRRARRGQPEANGLTAALDPQTGRALWTTTQYSVTAGCTISGADGRLYVGGYNQPNESTTDRYVWCLDARDGSLIWQSEPVRSSVNVITISKDFLFSNASGRDGHVIDKQTGKILSRFNKRYACTRFTVSGPYVLGANMDLIDVTANGELVSTGPSVDSRECVGATASNGRIYYTSQASGLQVAQVCGKEAKTFIPPWKQK